MKQAFKTNRKIIKPENIIHWVSHIYLRQQITSAILIAITKASQEKLAIGDYEEARQLGFWINLNEDKYNQESFWDAFFNFDENMLNSPTRTKTIKLVGEKMRDLKLLIPTCTERMFHLLQHIIAKLKEKYPDYIKDYDIEDEADLLKVMKQTHERRKLVSKDLIRVSVKSGRKRNGTVQTNPSNISVIEKGRGYDFQNKFFSGIAKQ